MMNKKIFDFHAHILPGLDHGCTSLDMAKEQLSLAADAGVVKILASSHFYPDRHTLDSYVKKRSAAMNEINDYANEKGIVVIPAAEVLLCPGLEEFEGLRELCIKNTRSLLLELPLGSMGEEYYESVESLIDDGYQIILAHADRYDIARVERLISLGALVQLNSSALDSFFISKKLKRILSSGALVAVGSDIHGINKKYYKSFKRAIKRLWSMHIDIFSLGEKYQ